MSGVTNPSTAPTTCRSCGLAIVFAPNARTRRMMPLERDDLKGEWALIQGVATHVGKAPAGAIAGVEPIPRYTSHFAQCPAASSWRR